MSDAPGRLEIFAVVLSLAAIVVVARSLIRTARSIKARFTFGAPYRTGTIEDNLFGLLMTLPLVLAAVVLAFLALAQAGLQADDLTARVGQVEARRSGWATVHVRFVPDPAYPRDQLLEGEVTGARWAIVGHFVRWQGGVKWLGLRDGHRVRYLVATNDTTGTTPHERADRAELDRLPRAADLLLRGARWIPGLTVTQEASPWFEVADRQVMILYATGNGYLADRVAETSSLY